MKLIFRDLDGLMQVGYAKIRFDKVLREFWAGWLDYIGEDKRVVAIQAHSPHVKLTLPETGRSRPRFGCRCFFLMRILKLFRNTCSGQRHDSG